MRSPGGYVPSEVKARRKKVWQQGLAMDFDTLSPRRLDDFRYAITTRAAYQSTAPPNFKAGRANPVVRALEALRGDAPAAGDRQGRHPGPRAGLLHPTGSQAVRARGHRDRDPRARDASPRGLESRPPVRALREARRRASSSAPGAGGSRSSTTARCRSPSPPPGSKVDLPPSLDGMYLTHQGQGAFWPAGEVRGHGGGPTAVTVTASRPSAAAARSRSRAAGLAGDAGRHPAGRQASGIARRLRALRGPFHRPCAVPRAGIASR